VSRYVLNYIWDGDELTLKQMREEQHETACYSVHCVGLVIDQHTRCIYLADPNGPLMLGGGIEFVSVPHARLLPGERASTAVSTRSNRQPGHAL
jgi:hypothetical protein